MAYASHSGGQLEAWRCVQCAMWREARPQRGRAGEPRNVSVGLWEVAGAKRRAARGDTFCSTAGALTQHVARGGPARCCVVHYVCLLVLLRLPNCSWCGAGWSQRAERAGPVVVRFSAWLHAHAFAFAAVTGALLGAAVDRRAHIARTKCDGEDGNCSADHRCSGSAARSTRAHAPQRRKKRSAAL